MKISLEAPTGATHRQLCRPCRGLLQSNARDRGFTAPAGVVSALSGLSLQSPRDCITMLKGRPHFGNLFRDCSLEALTGLKSDVPLLARKQCWLAVVSRKGTASPKTPKQ